MAYPDPAKAAELRYAMHPISDARNKAVALSRIRQLSSSGLPLEPFARSLFELLNDAIPYSPNRSILLDGSDDTDCFVVSNNETLAALRPFREFFIDKPEISGARYRQDINTSRKVLPSKTVWRHEDLALPDYLKADGYNAVMRPLAWHHILQVAFAENGRFVGYCPLWRSPDQKPFSSEDSAFLHASAAHITHGLKVALRTQAASPEPDDSAPLTGWGTGVVLTDATGKAIAMDATATLIFQQVGVLDGVGANAFAASRVREALEYVARTLQTIFDTPDGKALLQPPVYRLYQHWSGIVLNLRGVRMVAEDGREYVSVLVERGETPAARSAGLIARWGLSRREGRSAHAHRRQQEWPRNRDRARH